jgi:hypothetical protein
MRRAPREDTMTSMRRLLALMAAGALGTAAPVSAQADAPDPFSQARPQELRRDAGRHQHHERALDSRDGRRERRGERMERQGQRMEHRGRRMERRGHPHRARAWERRGEQRERWGERLERDGERLPRHREGHRWNHEAVSGEW